MRFDIRPFFLTVLLTAAVTACDEDGMGPPEVIDPTTAPRATVDRFADGVGTLFVRSENPELPGAGDP
ncbi:MAG: hypothetical protein R3324_14310, partial [Halobacteriales archaeon]|nr:hypothetical protein [Halobacteriales archaeon]